MDTHSKNKKQTIKICYLFTVICLLLSVYCYLFTDVFAAMSSANYKIPADSINIGGRDDSSSATYRIKDTIGEIATDESQSASFKLKAGYQQMAVEYVISISSPSDVSMTPAIGGVTGGVGNGQAVWTITTDNPIGYSASIKASANPALQSGANSFANYTPAGANPDLNWLIASTDSEFGFTPEGSHIIQKYKDDGVNCNTGALDTLDKCWYYFSTTDENIAYSSSSNQPTGAATTVKFRAQSGTSHLQVEGNYTATITMTAVMN